jgi:uncharacterized protein YycO
MPIRIQLVTEKWNPISASIRYSTRSWCSHIEFCDLSAGTTLGSRSIGGVKIRPSSKDHYTRVEQFVVDDYKIMQSAYHWALGQIGKPYDFSAITGMVVDRDWRNESKWFCSELIAAAFEAVDYPLLSTRPSVGVYRITPRDLLLSRQLTFITGTGI